MREVAVIGVGMTKWGELWEKSLRTIFVETALLALDDAGVDKIDSMYVVHAGRSQRETDLEINQCLN